MKPRINPTFRIASLATSFVLCLGQAAHAAPVTWDTTIAADATITAGSGTWTDGLGNWNDGTTSVGVNWSNATPDSATFAGADGNYTISLGGPITATGTLAFSNDGYTLSAASTQTISMATVNVSVASGKTAVIGTNAELKNTSGVAPGTLSGGGTLNVTGTGAKLTLGHNFTVAGNSTLNIGAGGSVTESVSFIVGDTTAQTGKVTVNGGNLSVTSNLIFANNATTAVAGQIDLNSGTITVTGNLRYGGATSTNGSGVFNLKGGTLIMNAAGSTIFENAAAVTSTFNFDGGTIKLGASNTATGGLFGTGGVDNAIVKVGGAKFDTNGFNASVAQVLQNGGGTDGGLTKTGTGTLTLNGSAVHTFNGGVKVNGGTLALDLANLTPPTNLVDSSNALTLGGGTLSILGKNVAAATSAQSFNGTTLNPGASTIIMNKGASATSATLNLGSLNRTNPGSTLTFRPNTFWTTAVSTTEIVSITGATTPGGTVTLPGSGNTDYLGAGVFQVIATGTRYAQVRNTGGVYNLVAAPSATPFVTTGGSASTAYSFTANQTLTGDLTNYAALANNSGAAVIDLAGFNYTLNGILSINSGSTTISSASPGTVVVGAENELVVNVTGSGSVTISAPIVNKSASNSSLTLTNGGSGTLTLSGLNTYTGTTTVNSGTLTLASTGQLKFAPTTNGTTNSVTGTGTALIDGKFFIDLSAANASNGNSWNLLNAATLSETFSSTFSVDSSLGAFTDPDLDNIWTLVSGANTWSFNEATGTLSVSTAVAGYSAWQSANGATGQTVDQDHDNDGVKNGIEYFLGGTAVTTGFTPVPTLVAGAVTWVKAATYTGAFGTDFKIQSSTNLSTWTDAASNASPGVPGTVYLSGNNVTYTMPVGAGKTFVRLLVNPN